MSDVLIVCTKCQHECKVSEYAASQEINCPKCGQRLAVPRPSEIKKLSRLSLRKAEGEVRLVEDQVERKQEEELREKNRDLNPHVMDRVHVRREKIKTPHSIWGWLVFLILGCLLVGLQYAMQENKSYLDYYIWLRVGVGVLTLVIALISAFEDSTIQGIFCLLIPGYIVYHVFVRSDSYILRGMMMSIVVASAAELHFMGDDSTIVHLQNWANSVIAGGSSLIDEASAPPAY